MITLNEIAEIAGVSKCSALKMAATHDWPMRKAVREGKRINLYEITREDVKKSIVQTVERRNKNRLAALGLVKSQQDSTAEPPKLSKEPELMTVEQIRKTICKALHIMENTARTQRIIKSAGWKSQSILKKGRWTLHYTISEYQIADAATKYYANPKVFIKPSGCARLPFDAGWSSQFGEAPTLTMLKNLDDLTTPWGAHPAKSIIKSRELFV